MDIRWKWLQERGFNVLADKHQYAYMQSLWAPLETVQAVFVDARAGTGKTSLAVLAGAYEVEKGTYDKIIYVRNSVPIRDQGFLPGSISEREAPYMRPLVKAMDRVQPGAFEVWSRMDMKTKQPRLEAITTSYVRGDDWERAYVIIDEAQSLDLEELQAVYTRVHDTCKVVTIGSTRQVDNKKLRRVGGLTPFEVYMRHFEGFPAAFHKLERDYRGFFSQRADDIMDTVDKLKGAL